MITKTRRKMSHPHYKVIFITANTLLIKSRHTRKCVFMYVYCKTKTYVASEKGQASEKRTHILARLVPDT